METNQINPLTAFLLKKKFPAKICNIWDDNRLEFFCSSTDEPQHQGARTPAEETSAIRTLHYTFVGREVGHPPLGHRARPGGPPLRRVTGPRRPLAPGQQAVRRLHGGRQERGARRTGVRRGNFHGCFRGFFFYNLTNNRD